MTGVIAAVVSVAVVWTVGVVSAVVRLLRADDDPFDVFADMGD